jgi:hypothetical protein
MLYFFQGNYNFVAYKMDGPLFLGELTFLFLVIKNKNPIEIGGL